MNGWQLFWLACAAFQIGWLLQPDVPLTMRIVGWIAVAVSMCFYVLETRMKS